VEESRRLHELIGRTFEQVASQAGSMVSADFLQTAINAYDRAGLVKESRRLRVLMEETIAASCDEAGEITFETSIPKEDMETFLGQIVVPDLASTFARIAIGFLPSRNRLEECVSKLQEQTPLMAVIGQSIIGDRQVSAKVGSTEDDPFGRLVRRAYNEMWLSEIWLIAALRRTLETHEAIPAHFVTWAARSRVFDDLTLLHEGVAAWIEADFVKAIHVLIPQVEKGLRGIASELGRPVTRAHPAAMGTSVTVGMGELLYSTDMQKVLGPDLTLYFLTLYADPRGFNLRNAVAHGLLSVDGMHEGVATRLIQTLLVLGAWKALVRARSNVSNRAAPDSGGDTLHDS
jgi:lysyl-tRNA synthetase class 1